MMTLPNCRLMKKEPDYSDALGGYWIFARADLDQTL